MENSFSVVGGGIGGCSSAVHISKKYPTTLFEKEPYLGGCASTFKKNKHFYNAGATTFAGYDKGNILHDFFSKYEIDFEKKKLDFALCVVIGGKKIYRYQEFDRFLESINSVFPHKKNIEFWKLIYDINKEFYKIKNYYYSQKNHISYYLSILSFRTLFFKFYKYLFTDAKSFIEEFYGKVDKEYLEFLDNQCIVVAQAKTKDINFLTAALALGYHFLSNFYIYGGMGSIFKQMKTKISDVKMNSKIEKIEKKEDLYLLHTKNKTYSSKNLVLNTTIFDSDELFDDKEILSYLDRYRGLYDGISAYTLYITLNKNHNFHHHYQFIEKQSFSYSISNSIFVSFGDKDDEKLKNSITISIHTKTSFWYDEYEKKKEKLKHEILGVLKERLNIDNSMIKEVFGGTPYTFKRFINRLSLGGIPVKSKNLFFKLPSNVTPIKGLYLVGDTSFAAQGWMGVMMGVNNLGKFV